jgi:hypothetical protein
MSDTKSTALPRRGRRRLAAGVIAAALAAAGAGAIVAGPLSGPSGAGVTWFQAPPPAATS